MLSRHKFHTFGLAVAAMVVCALLLRFWGIDLRSISHPEVYVPGIPLPPGISEPPPRLDFASALRWHFHEEPHPIGRYLAMYGWTSGFGTSIMWIRLPSALFGAAAVALIAYLGRRVWDEKTGLLAGAMLTLHGFHIFWSQMARMYAAGTTLALLSVLLLVHLASSGRKRPGLEAAYVLTVVAAVQTVELFWPLLAMQIVWVGLIAPELRWPGLRLPLRSTAGAVPRLLQVQTLALLCAVPALTHAIYNARGGAALPPTLDFLRDYLGFGFLYQPESGMPVTLLLVAVLWGLAIVSVVTMTMGFRAGRVPEPAMACCREPLPRWLLPGAAIGASLLMIWLGSIVHGRRSLPLMLFGAAPLVLLALPAVAGGVRSALAMRVPGIERWLNRQPPLRLLFVLCGAVAPLLLFAASFKVTVLASRAFLVFVPYTLLLAAAGLSRLMAMQPRLGGLAAAAVGAIFAGSVAFSWQRVGSVIDYRGLAAALEPELLPGDLVFVRDKSWIDTPLFYYLPREAYVTRNWDEVLSGRPDARVWVIRWSGEDGGDAARWEAVAHYNQIGQVTARNGTATLYKAGAAH